MTTECWFTGKHWDGFISEGMAFYEKRIKPLSPLSMVFLKEGGAGPDALEKEGSQMRKRLRDGDLVILLDENGQSMDSRGFAGYLDQLRNRSPRRLIFIIGGAYGFAPDIRELSYGSLSLSPMTFNHQLARLVFLEQYYRALTILKGHPYHHD